jgi:transcriptional regulatory protein RtcR
MKKPKTVVIGLLGSVLDQGFHQQRWDKWRPTVSLCKHETLPIARLELLYPEAAVDTARCVAADIGRISSDTEVRLREHTPKDPWDFEEVYGMLHDFAMAYPFRPEEEDYLVHITTGTHVQQICLFLLTESRHLPARLVQTSPAVPRRRSAEGNYNVIDLDLSRYDRIAARFQTASADAISFLKSGIATRNPAFNGLMEEIEQVSIQSRDPILLTGPTGAGKSQLARRIFELKRSRHQVVGNFVEVNCATIRGDAAMSTLFGHVKGAFTGAVKDRPGLLRAADKGVLFLDEVGELGLDEQAMLLRALEEKKFSPLGADREVGSDFQLLAGTNRHLPAAVREGRFREDLLARMNLWTFRLPGLAERHEDIEPNLDYELERFAARNSLRATMSSEVRERFLQFASGRTAKWSANFRDLNASVTRMATLAPGGRITQDILNAELERLECSWTEKQESDPEDLLVTLMDDQALQDLDLFDRAQLATVVRVCAESASLSEAGRKLFGVTRQKRKVQNDADRLRKYLARFGLEWRSLAHAEGDARRA